MKPHDVAPSSLRHDWPKDQWRLRETTLSSLCTGRPWKAAPHLLDTAPVASLHTSHQIARQGTVPPDQALRSTAVETRTGADHQSQP